MAKKTEQAMRRLRELPHDTLAIYVDGDRWPILVGWLIRIERPGRTSLWLVDDWRQDRLARACT